ncbi:recombinase family protein, partial [Flavonifractor sp. An9]|uniref:recombinase family protein n=2 Tax=unclassified Flavonifractor TaxID=2629267 RepID=UPI001FA82663
GVSGTRFDRPGFLAMMEEVEAGRVEAIVIKDMSRLGRDYLKVGQVMEILRQRGVRLIAINDGVDSLKGDDDFTPFRNIMNEFYARDTSRKIRSVFKSKGMSGKHLTGTVIYGYLWDEKREHWLVDEEAAEVVRRIFSLTMEGYGPYQISKLLSEAKVEIPAVHLARFQEGVNRTKPVKDPYGWGSSTIVNILKKREYLGHTINFKTRKHFKDKKSHYVDESEWTIFENTHEAIIDQETFDNVQRIRANVRRYPDGWGEAHPLTGLMYCADCGGKMYIKNPDDPRFWVIDPEAAAVVQRIYQMTLEGSGLAEIAAALGADGIVNPTYYWRSRGVNRSGSKSTVEPTKWGHTTVKKILTLQEYCGDVINFKSYSKSYKIKRRIENPEENRAIFLNVHEPIIDRATWEKVQALTKGTRRKRPQVTQEPSVFSGYLKCPECGGNLNFHFNQGNHDIKFFSCQNHNSGLRKCSSTHYIRLDFLERVVLYEVNRLAAFSSEYEDDFIKAIMGRSAKVAENVRVRKQRELDGLLARDKELDMLFERLYEDNVAGKIDDARFAKMAKRYEQEQGENGKRIKTLRLELKQSESKRMDIDDFLTTVRRYTNAAKITKRMVGELIDHIDVYQAEKQDGVTTQRVVIHYNCIGAFDVPDRRKIPEADIIMETRKGVAVSYAPAV